MKQKKENQSRFNNALNHCGFSAVVFLFSLVHSPIWPLLEKLRSYDNVRVFLAEAHDDDIDDFIPGYTEAFTRDDMNKINAELENLNAIEAEREV